MHEQMVVEHPKNFERIISDGRGLLLRTCTKCGERDDEKKRAFRQRAAIQDSVSHAPPVVHDVLHEPGLPLDAGTRAFFEPRFGHDFSSVRVHTDPKAAESAYAVNAIAYTVGNHLVFAEGQFMPGTPRGRILLSHELTHSIQQGSGARPPSSDLTIADTHHPSEKEARDISESLVHRQDTWHLQDKPMWIPQQVNSPKISREPANQRTCGPDITNWFVSLMNSAKTNPQALLINQDLEGSRRVGARFGYSSMDVLEGGLVRKVVGAERAAGNPPRTTDASRQLSSADPRNQFGRALIGATLPIAGAPEQIMLLLIRRASMRWKSLVETGAIWDFKNNLLSGSRLATAGCPDPCSDPPTVTICGTCLEHDLPGNLFYAYMGRYVGFSLNALQLGSQYAELQADSSSTWDPPEDTFAISLGYNFPATITRSNLCPVLNGASGSVTVRNCPVCPGVYSP